MKQNDSKEFDLLSVQCWEQWLAFEAWIRLKMWWALSESLVYIWLELWDLLSKSRSTQKQSFNELLVYIVLQTIAQRERLCEKRENPNYFHLKTVDVFHRDCIRAAIVLSITHLFLSSLIILLTIYSRQLLICYSIIIDLMQFPNTDKYSLCVVQCK